jgi:hypothetical protein
MSIFSGCYSIYQIFLKVVQAAKPPEDITSVTTSFLILDYSFWMWSVLAWVSAYLLIKNFIILREVFFDI